MKKWISAARLRTLPLAVSSILAGGFLAYAGTGYRNNVFIWAIITTLLLQILSNFANDYGDSLHGADSHERVGPKRATQSGAISRKQMLNGVIILALASLLSGIYLLYQALGTDYTMIWLLFLGLGLISIWAAYEYTAGKKPYGYMGLGDISVFIFFGLLGVVGSYFLITLQLDPLILLPAISLGCLATGVLNINNIRDINSDLKAGKITIPVRLGLKKAKIYHWALLITAMISIAVFMTLKHAQWYYLISFPLIILNGIQVSKSENPDPYLKILALTSVFFVMVLGFSLIF